MKWSSGAPLYVNNKDIHAQLSVWAAFIFTSVVYLLKSQYIIHNMFVLMVATWLHLEWKNINSRLGKTHLTNGTQKKAGSEWEALSVYIRYLNMFALLNKARSGISGSTDDFTPWQDVINESLRCSAKEGKDRCFCSSWRKDVDDRAIDAQ